MYMQKPLAQHELDRNDVLAWLSGRNGADGGVCDLLVRFVSMNDAGKAARDAWISRIFRTVEHYAFTDDDVSALSLAFADYDVFVLGGADASRMARYARNNRRILNRKIKLCVLSDAHPRRRAALLSAGFDDVIDTARTHPVEAIARIQAIKRRYDAKFGQEQRADAETRRIGAVADAGALTPREREIVRILLDAPNNTIRYEALVSRLSTPQRCLTLNSLKVAISQLRPKLTKGVQIVAHTGRGYQLLAGSEEGSAG